MIWITSLTNTWSGVIFEYHVCTNSLMITEMIPYSWRSTAFELVKGGSTSSIGRGVLRPFSPFPSSVLWEHRVRRINAAVALSEVVSGWSFWESASRVGLVARAWFGSLPPVDGIEVWRPGGCGKGTPESRFMLSIIAGGFSSSHEISNDSNTSWKIAMRSRWRSLLRITAMWAMTTADRWPGKVSLTEAWHQPSCNLSRANNPPPPSLSAPTCQP